MSITYLGKSHIFDAALRLANSFNQISRDIAQATFEVEDSAEHKQAMGEVAREIGRSFASEKLDRHVTFIESMAEGIREVKSTIANKKPQLAA